MQALERSRIIKQYLQKHKQAQVQALSSLIGVSEVTIRRDLERLEAQGHITRTHGGAVLKEENKDPLAEMMEKAAENHEEARLAQVALKMIKDNDVVMLLNGPINYQLAGLLQKRSALTVLTNDAAIALRISLQETNRVVLLGGELDRQEKASFGSMALANLERYFVNKLFFESDGISPDLHLTVKTQEKADLINAAAKVSTETILLCGTDKFGSNAFFRLGSMDRVQKVIASADLKEEYKSLIFKTGLPLFTSAEAFEGIHED